MKSIRYQTRRITLTALNFLLSCRMFVLKISPASAGFFQAITVLVYEPVQHWGSFFHLTNVITPANASANAWIGLPNGARLRRKPSVNAPGHTTPIKAPLPAR